MLEKLDREFRGTYWLIDERDIYGMSIYVFQRCE